MIKTDKINVIIILVFLMCCFKPAKAQNIELVMKGIRSEKGQIVIGIYNTEKSFKEDKPIFRKKFSKHNLSDKEMVVRFELKPGTYGFALLDDENNNDEMEYNIIGVPKEGFGFSDYVLSGLSRPKFEYFKFDLHENETRKVLIEVKYM